MSNLFDVPIPAGCAPFEAYRKLTPDTYRAGVSLARALRGLPIVHVNATPRGGGVAEMLQSQITLERSLGLKSRWLAMRAPQAFFAVTKQLHNLLQGKIGRLTPADRERYEAVNRELGPPLRERLARLGPQGIAVVHDPQPLPLGEFIPPGWTAMLRLHMDLSSPNPTTLEFLRPHIERYPMVVISNPQYRPPFAWLPPKRIRVIHPAIDPFTEKNRPMALATAHSILTMLGVNCAKPIMAQVSRLDPWKDPIGVVAAYYRAKNEVPDLQLVLAGLIEAQDDPEAIAVRDKVLKHAKGDPDIYLFSDIARLEAVSIDSFIAAVYTAGDVIVQKSLREGFGLTITEAMWKEKAVVAGRTAGTAVQIRNGKSGILVSSPEETARAVVRLLNDIKLRARLGKAARASVKKQFLMPRLIVDHLEAYAALRTPQAQKKTAPRAALRRRQRAL